MQGCIYRSMQLGKLSRLKSILPVGAREKDTEYDGLFSYAGEWHSAIIGGAVGLFGSYEMLVFMVAVAIDEEISAGNKAVGEFRREPWYGLGVMAAAYLVRVTFFSDRLPNYTLAEILNAMLVVA